MARRKDVQFLIGDARIAAEIGGFGVLIFERTHIPHGLRVPHLPDITESEAQMRIDAQVGQSVLSPR